MTQSSLVPYFFIVGQAKSGTTALYQMLGQHPAIFLSTPKEPMFLARDMWRRFKPPMGAELPTTLDEYLALFKDARPDQLKGEASTLYASSRTAASAIAVLNPAARAIAIFREPAAFLRSLHLQLVQMHNENERDLRRALALEADRRQGKHVPRRSHRPQLLYYTDHVCYTDQLARYHAVLPRENVLALIYEDFRADNAATLREIYRFLGIDDTVEVTQVSANPTVLLRSRALDGAVRRFSVGSDPVSQTIKTGIKTAVPERLRRTLLRTVQRRVVHAEPPPPDPATLAELRSTLKPEVERFSDYLGRDLVRLWGYDRL
jgi:hypothetical protein